MFDKYIGSIVYVEPSTDHVGGYGRLIAHTSNKIYLVEFKHILTEEVREDEIKLVC